jgi:hypothetical protein
MPTANNENGAQRETSVAEDARRNERLLCGQHVDQEQIESGRCHDRLDDDLGRRTLPALSLALAI